MGPKPYALYTTSRIVLLAFALAAAFQNHWALVAFALLARSVIWWVALPHRRNRRTGRTLREHMAEKNRETVREFGFSDIALKLAKMPRWVGVPCRLMLLLPMRTMGDRTANALLLYGRGAGTSLLRLEGWSNADDRENAARALAELRPEGYEAALRPLLADPVDAVKAVAEAALGANVGSASSDPFLRLVRSPRDEPVPDDLVRSLRAVFEMASAGERRATFERIGERGGPAAIDWLIELVGSKKVEAFVAVDALKGVDDPRVADALLEYARSVVGFTALRELVERGDARVEPILLERLGPASWMTRGLFVGMLAKLPTESAQAEALRRTEKGGWLSRMFAAEAVAFSGGNLEPLQRYARSWRPLTRLFARLSLRRLERRTVERAISR